ncbi:MAG: carbonic anhydrase [Gammaproteobacteria bacterium]|nr:carbonic anhydrase [Gammaproteobacteria bacterium]MDH5800414.1 carbonic anhydrase [Gammaproteobacteria bacterium]
MISAEEAIQRLREGNQRFVTGNQERAMHEKHRTELVAGQNPFAVILGCSDSRVPAELVFDQGLGDLFVIRVAGNIVAPSQVGSVEFAVECFGTQLVVVLGHTLCGAIQATLEQLDQPQELRSANLASIVNRIRPSIETLVDVATTPEKLVQLAVRANIRASVNQLQHGSVILENLVQQGKLTIVGAEYSLETGVVKIFDY